MGGIADKHVEWAVVNRLKAMLDDPPKTKFNVTQSFALFTAVVLWAKQRAWVRDADILAPADHAARAVRIALQDVSIFDTPWLLSKSVPNLPAIDGAGADLPGQDEINSDFVDMSAEQFIKWLRDALAHGDGRTVTPLHKQSRKGDKTLLAGFRIVFQEARTANRRLTLSLYHDDMKRIGTILADEFCRGLSGGDQYFEAEASTRSIKEAA